MDSYTYCNRSMAFIHSFLVNTPISSDFNSYARTNGKSESRLMFMFSNNCAMPSEEMVS